MTLDSRSPKENVSPLNVDVVDFATLDFKLNYLVRWVNEWSSLSCKTIFVYRENDKYTLRKHLGGSNLLQVVDDKFFFKGVPFVEEKDLSKENVILEPLPKRVIACLSYTPNSATSLVYGPIGCLISDAYKLFNT